MKKYFEWLCDEVVFEILGNISVLDYFPILLVNRLFRKLILSLVTKNKINELVQKNQLKLLKTLDNLGYLELNLDLSCVSHYCCDYKLLLWLRDRGAEIDEKTFRQSLINCNIDIVKYLISNKCKWPSDIYHITRENAKNSKKNMNLYKFIYYQPCPWTTDVFHKNYHMDYRCIS